MVVAWMIEYCIPGIEYIEPGRQSVMWGRTMGDIGDMSHWHTVTPDWCSLSDLGSLARFIQWLGLVNARWGHTHNTDINYVRANKENQGGAVFLVVNRIVHQRSHCKFSWTLNHSTAEVTNSGWRLSPWTDTWSKTKAWSSGTKWRIWILWKWKRT